MKTAKLFLLILSIFSFGMLLTACKSSAPLATEATAESPRYSEVVFLQLNDVYEIAPLAGGKQGGMARVASLIKSLEAKHTQVYGVLAGDFLSPSVIGTVKLDGRRVGGAQMVDMMNMAGLDFVTFGNHEFDLNLDDLQRRIDESKFEWISSNVFQRTSQYVQPFMKQYGAARRPVQPYKILLIPGPDGEPFRLGILGVCLDFTQKDYVSYQEVKDAARRTCDFIRPYTDAVVALTHLNIGQDRELAQAIPELHLLMGGHEHENHIERVGSSIIAKADANAKSAYIHRLKWEPSGRKLEIESELVQLDESIPLDPEVDQAVKQWEDKAYKGFAALGFDLKRQVTVFEEKMDGREVAIRNRATNLGQLIARALFESKTGTDLALLNSGSIRIDDELQGPINEFDIVRMLPFGGAVLHADIRGDILEKTLNTGLGPNAGSGGYLQVWNVSKSDTGWMIGRQPLDRAKNYRVCLPQFLLSGVETGLGFLKEGEAGISKPDKPGENDLRRDIRLLLINYLRR